MSLNEYDGEAEHVESIQRQLDERINAIRGQSAYSDAGMKAEMARSVLDARAQVDAMKADFVADREARRDDLMRLAFGNPYEVDGSELIANRDAQDRAAQLGTADDAKAMLRRANQNADDSLARAVAEQAFGKGWHDVAQDYAVQTGKSGALDELMESHSHLKTKIADSIIFRVRAPEELGTASDSILRNLAGIHAPGMGPASNSFIAKY